jgi:hypothetical protein
MELKVQPGDPITADFMNRVIDRLPEERAGFPAGGAAINRTTMEVINDSGTNREIGEILYLSAFDGSTESHFDAVQSIGLEATAPVWHSEIDSVGVCAEPIPSGERGLVVVSGLCLINVLASITVGHTHVMIDPTATTSGRTSYSGIAKILSQFTLDSSVEVALCILGQDQPLWRYECTGTSSAPSATSVTLKDRRGNTYGTVDLLDPLSIMSDQTAGDEGWCIQCGNEFEAIQAPCV